MTEILILKMIMKYPYSCFCTKTQYSFILDYMGVGVREEVYGG